MMRGEQLKLLPVSLGCDKNLCDLEEMLGALSRRGFIITEDEREADIILVNSCAFIGDAREESINTIIEMAAYKKNAGDKGVCRLLIVTGCLAQRYAEEIREEIPEVDAVIGTTAYDEILNVIDRCLTGERVFLLKDINRSPLMEGKRFLTTGGHYAYLKIAEGCDKHCSYCIIPKLRGSYRSVPMDILVKKAGEMVEDGVKELILVAQETTLYGTDLYGKKSLTGLLEKLCRLEGLHWIRILYAYPEEIDDELIDLMAKEDKICKYIDMPIQSGSDRILKRMGRRTNREELEGLIDKLRKRIPGIVIRTTLISGFPGETVEDHIESYNLADEMEFDRMGVFTYSPEEGTAAFGFDGKVLEEIKEERREELMLLQQEIAFEKAEKMAGRVFQVFVEGFLPDEGVYVGRTYMDAPDVDGLIFFESDRSLMSGDMVSVKVTASKEYDLIGELIDEYSK